jgi:hypothetical protein
MRMRAILREAARDITSGTTRFTLLGTALTILICGLILTDSFTLLQQLNAAKTFRESGGATLILTAQGRIDGSACDALQELPGVIASGAFRDSTRKITITVLPNAPAPEYEVTPGVPNLLAADRAATSGLTVSQELAASLGAKLGDSLTTARGTVPISGIYSYPSDGRRPGLGYAVLSTTNSSQAFDECWISAWPQISNAHSLLYSTLRAGLTDTKKSPQLSQLNASLGTEFDGHELFFSRITRASPIAALAIAFALGYSAVRARKLQIASALHAGLSRSDLICIHLAQVIAWATPATIVGLGTAALISGSAGAGDQLPLFLQQAGIPLAAFAGALVGALVATATVTERQLFRYFKDR